VQRCALYRTSMQNYTLHNQHTEWRKYYNNFSPGIHHIPAEAEVRWCRRRQQICPRHGMWSGWRSTDGVVGLDAKLQLGKALQKYIPILTSMQLTILIKNRTLPISTILHPSISVLSNSTGYVDLVGSTASRQPAFIIFFINDIILKHYLKKNKLKYSCGMRYTEHIYLVNWLGIKNLIWLLSISVIVSHLVDNVFKGRLIQFKNSSITTTGWPLSRHSEIPWHFPDNVRHSCPC